MKSSQKSDYIKKIQGERIKECMDLCGITGKYIAKKLNYSPQHISYIINGKRNLTIDMAISLANLFSEHLGGRPKSFKIPYKELSESQKLEYDFENTDHNGYVDVLYDDPSHVDYRYLLGEADYMDNFENFDPPVEKSTDYLFKTGVAALLHHYGYDLNINKFCPDITLFKNLNPKFAPMHKMMRDVLTNPANKSEIINIATGETLELLPAELYQLFQDFTKAITGIIDRKFEEQQWMDRLNSTPPFLSNPDEEIPFD